MGADVLRLVVPGMLAVLALMGALWLLHLRLRNAGIVDVGWAAGLGFLALFYAALGPGWETRRLLVALLGGLWSLRLALHLALRLRGRPEEGRYEALREEWSRAGRNVPLSFLLFFLAQGVLDVVLSVPFLLAALDPAPRLSAPEIAGAFVWGISLAGEGVADAQLARFKADPRNRGQVCRPASGTSRVTRTTSSNGSSGSPSPSSPPRLRSASSRSSARR